MLYFETFSLHNTVYYSLYSLVTLSFRTGVFFISLSLSIRHRPFIQSCFLCVGCMGHFFFFLISMSCDIKSKRILKKEKGILVFVSVLMHNSFSWYTRFFDVIILYCCALLAVVLHLWIWSVFALYIRPFLPNNLFAHSSCQTSFTWLLVLFVCFEMFQPQSISASK